MATRKQNAPAPLNDHAFMSDPRHWPRWPWLPMKKVSNHGYQCALLHADACPDQPCKLYAVNLYEVRTYFPTTEMPVAGEFHNFDDILAQGWKID